jgi:hypothetical protein
MKGISMSHTETMLGKRVSWLSVVISIGVFVKDVSNWRTDCSVYRGLLTNPLADYETKKMVARDLKNPPKLFGFIDVIAHE